MHRRINARRITWLDQHLNTTKYKLAKDNNRMVMFTWLDTHTSGKFYLGGNIIAFEDERDMLMFRLGWKQE